MSGVILSAVIELAVLTLDWASAKPIVVSQVSEKASDLTAVLMSDKVLGPLLGVQLMHLLVTLIKWIWSSEKKKLEEIQKACANIPMLVHKVERLDEHVKQKVLTRDETELLIWKTMRDRDS